MMGGGWTIKSDNPHIVGLDWGTMLAVSYEKDGAPNYCYRLWCFAYRDTDLF